MNVLSVLCCQVRLQVGLYVVYLLDWLTVFDKDQILVLRLEDHASNMRYTMHMVFRFLDLGRCLLAVLGKVQKVLVVLLGHLCFIKRDMWEFVSTDALILCLESVKTNMLKSP